MADDLDDEWWLENKEEGDGEGQSAGEDETEQTENQPSSKRKKKQKENGENKKKKKKTLTDELAEKDPQPAVPQDLITLVQKHFKGKLTAVQFDEIQLEDGHFLPVRDVKQSPTEYLKEVVPDWAELTSAEQLTDKGSPVMLVLCSSAIRCVQLIRDIASFKGKKDKVAKLFAKHFKVKEQADFLSKHAVAIGVGTPNRVKLLIESDHLKLDSLKYVILDWTWRDQKLKRLVDQADIRADLMSLLHEQLMSLMMDEDRSVMTGLL